MKILNTPIAGVNIIESAAVSDQRGSFMRLFCISELAPVLGERSIVQINHSFTSQRGAVRGMHFQNSPHAEMKLVRCLRGKVRDVALDLRAGSPTFLKWHAEELSAENGRMLTIPEGCAHGFQALEPDSELLYLHTQFYAPSAEGGIRYDDPLCSILWPLPVTEISARDASYTLLDKTFCGIVL
jgi:dTDP-4-dehydrorhamnose 3,5-epimerase